MTRKILVVSPHADDAEIGCAGYLSRSIREDSAIVRQLVLSVKDEFQYYEGGIVTGATRIKELEAASKIVGYDEINVLSTFGGIDQYPVADIVRWLDEAVKNFRPDEVLIPYPSFHQEHKLCFDICMSVTRPTKANMVKAVLVYEYPPAFWTPNPILGGAGSMYVNITDYIETKKDVLSCYPTQIGPSGGLVSMEAILGLASFRGMECGVGYAEKYTVMRRII